MRWIFKGGFALGGAILTVSLLVTASSVPAAAWGEASGPGSAAAGIETLVAEPASFGPADGDCYFTHRPFFDRGGTFHGMSPAAVCS